MTNVSDIKSIKFDTLQLWNYISLVLSEIDLNERISEIKKNFANPSESQRIIVPILGRISTIKFEKFYLEQELYLNWFGLLGWWLSYTIKWTKFIIHIVKFSTTMFAFFKSPHNIH